MPTGQEVQGHEKYTIYFWFCERQAGFWRWGRKSLLFGGCPESRGPRPFALKGGLGAQQTGAPVPSLPPLPLQNLMQCFRVWGPGPESARRAAAIVVSYPALTLHHKGFLRSPVP